MKMNDLLRSVYDAFNKRGMSSQLFPIKQVVAAYRAKPVLVLGRNAQR